jgi:hypothetical protein
MTENWWAIQNELEARAREIRLAARGRGRWIAGPGKSERKQPHRALKTALGRLLIAWGSSLARQTMPSSARVA